ncbi:MAG: hypothetical protein ACYC3L_09860 [Gemmatimonadaceae bacterium]
MIPREPLRTGALATLRAAVTNRWPVKLAALALAVVLWLVVRAEEPTEVVINARFVPLLDSSLVLTSEAPATVEVVVTGRTREVLKLYTNPPVVVRRFDDESLRGGSVRVALSPADVDFPTGVEARARDVRPRTFTLTFRSRAAADSAHRP